MRKTEPIRQANRDREWTQDMREHMRGVCAGKKNGFFGKTHSDATRAVMSEKAKARVRVPPTLARCGVTVEQFIAATKEGKKFCKIHKEFLPKKKFRDQQAYCSEHYVITQRLFTLRRRGLTPEGYAALLEAQGNRCAICQTMDKGQREWNVDHSHSTGKVRGLLCRGCNVALHKLDEDLTWATKAIHYLAVNS